MPRYIGSNGEVQPQPDERTWTRNKGWTTYNVWVGPQAAVDGFVPSIIGGAYDTVEISHVGGIVYKVRASSSGLDEVNTWELLGAGLNEPLSKNPNYAALPPEQRGFLDDYSRTGIIDPAATSFFGATATYIYLALKREQLHYQASQWILRSIKTISSRSPIVVGMSNVEKLHRTSELPVTEIYPHILTAINAIQAPTMLGGYVWKWLKQTPTITSSLSAMTQITQEWWLYQWPTFMYSEVSTG